MVRPQDATTRSRMKVCQQMQKRAGSSAHVCQHLQSQAVQRLMCCMHVPGRAAMQALLSHSTKCGQTSQSTCLATVSRPTLTVTRPFLHTLTDTSCRRSLQYSTCSRAHLCDLPPCSLYLAHCGLFMGASRAGVCRGRTL